MATLTLSMIVKNEEQHLGACLESIKGIADEIVVVDTGSTDNTIKIAESFNSKIFSFEWVNDFSAARNFALSKSTGNWILYLDADERLKPESLKELRQIIKGNKKTGIWCKVVSLDDKNNRPNLMKYIRLFKNSPGIKFTGKAHEQIIQSLVSNGYSLSNSKIEILHYGYNVDKEVLDKKASRNLELLLSEYRENSDSYIAFQIAQSYAILKNETNARYYFERALLDTNLSGEYKTIAYRYLAGLEYNGNNLGRAKELIDKGLSLGYNQPLLFMVASQIYFKINQKEKAEDYCRKAYEYNNKLLNGELESAFDLLVDSDIIAFYGIDYAIKNKNKSTYNFYYNELKKMNTLNGKSEIELELIHKLFNNIPLSESETAGFAVVVDEKNLDLFLSLIENYNRAESKLSLLQELKGKYTGSIRLFNILGNTLVSLGKTKEAKLIWESRISDDIYDPSTVLYLVSIYIADNERDKINTLLNRGLHKFSAHPAVVNILNGVRQRIAN
ncbi:MAG TPA: glycosyltransferase [Ignavibacteriaceae bacterium]|nr:glycosyltransferase [Ignavibacteriaceae bacterium]